MGQDLVPASQFEIVAPGHPILDSAFPLISKPNPATFRLAETSGEIPNIWDPKGGMIPYFPYKEGTANKSTIIMYYGKQPLEYIKNPNVIADAKAKGLSEVDDFFVGDYEAMHGTYKVKGTDKYLSETPLKPGSAPVEVYAAKTGGVVFVEPDKYAVHSLETLAGNKPPAEVPIGNIIAKGHYGEPYSMDVAIAIGKNKPVGPASEEVFKIANEFIGTRKNLIAEIGENAAKPAIKEAWIKCVDAIKKVKV